MTKLQSSNVGYPRIGDKREWKRALESFWKEEITQDELIEKTDEIRLNNLKKQKDLGVDLIPVGDFTLYDHVLDTSTIFGIVPERYNYSGGEVNLETFFAMARGNKEAVASEMTKWFNTNYHYMVPELDAREPELVENLPLKYYKEAKEKLGIDGKPVILGPLTYIKLAKGYDDKDFKQILDKFVPLYAQILKELQDAGATWVQIDEPIFSTNESSDVIEYAQEVYEAFKQAAPGLKIIIQTYFERIFDYEKVTALPVAGVGVDFIHGESLQQLEASGFPEDKVLFAGVVDGRNVWRADLDKRAELLDEIQKHVSADRVVVQPSSSLLHVPVTKTLEEGLDEIILGGLSFADQKLEEVIALANGKEASAEAFADNRKALDALNNSSYRTNKEVKASTENLTEKDSTRSLPFAERIEKQDDLFKLPVLPTTTIGSLPQTFEVRRSRTNLRNGVITPEQYEEFINGNIEKWIKIQEELDIDVLVHGEFERNDMVEYFGEKLQGFGVTQFGWVQSYGSRCVKPPLIFGDVYWEEPITVKESAYAQSLTDRPVKGMLTGPVTIYNWSFVHDDVPMFTVMNQIGLAIRKEIEALEAAGIKIIQVDEPALREGLPLDRAKWDEYLEASAYAFRLTAATAEPDTQIHTHMCYSNFEDIFGCIDALDADVISIETSRSHGELVSTFEDNTYTKEIGLGVYDIHSPRVPSVEEIKLNIDRALKTISPKQFWVNPDCGLKTRNEEETIGALKVMIEAAKEVRSEIKNK